MASYIEHQMNKYPQEWWEYYPNSQEYGDEDEDIFKQDEMVEQLFKISTAHL